MREETVFFLLSLLFVALIHPVEGFVSLRLSSLSTLPLHTLSSSGLGAVRPGSREPKEVSSSPLHIYETLREKLKGTCVYLIGMTGCGKSSTSTVFADKLGYRMLDTDEIAEYMVRYLTVIHSYTLLTHFILVRNANQ